MKKTILILMIFLLMPIVYGAGICSLHKPTPFIAGEIATLECSCSLPNEEGISGYIVFKMDNGTILSSVPINSGSCRTSFFGNAIIIPNGIPYNGTARFSDDENGTIDPTNWDSVSDDPIDEFQVTTGTITSCIIKDVKIPNTINLGVKNDNVFRVIDSVTNNSISNIQCQALAFDTDESPILIQPYGKDRGFYVTGHNGIGYLEDTFSQDRFKTKTTYRFKLICNCLNFSDNACYDDNTGLRLGYKSCEIDSIFTTSEDKREIDSFPYLRIIIFIVFFSIAMLFYHASDKTTVREKAYFYSIISTTFLLFISFMIWFGFKIIISGNVWIDGLNNFLALIILIISVWIPLYILLIKQLRTKNKENDLNEDDEEIIYY